MAKIDDEYVLSRNTLTTDEARKYLGMSWWELTDGLRNKELPFGTAKLGRGGKWTYNIPCERIYKYKKGLDLPTPEEELKQLIIKLIEMLEQFYGGGAAV